MAPVVDCTGGNCDIKVTIVMEDNINGMTVCCTELHPLIKLNTACSAGMAQLTAEHYRTFTL